MKSGVYVCFIIVVYFACFVGMLSIPDLNYGYKYNECTIKTNNFKQHKIKHFHKSKEYTYNHHTPCECNKYGDLYDRNYKQDPRDYIIF